MTKNVLFLPGDGIGPEVASAARKVLNWFGTHENFAVKVTTGLIGGAAIDVAGVPLAPATLAAACAADAVLLGAVGGPKWANQSFNLRPEAGLLDLRGAMQVFANLRPAVLFPSLSEASTLKPETVAGLDLMIVRELTGGVYFGEPRGVTELPDGKRRGINTHSYTCDEIRRVARVAFELARERKGVVCSADKANVMEAGLLWREEVQKLRDAEYSDVKLSHMLADNCAMQLVRAPLQFDVILTDNLFGDILSDQAAMLTGSLGMLPSASLGAPGKPGLYEPIHGSAPDIAGKNYANPCGMILSLALAFRHTLERPDLAARLECAVSRALENGVRTRDIGGAASTAELTDAVLFALGEKVVHVADV
ncbi:MAG: 3-isopropylmalate dehydrogenase [Rhodospirillaceae bacterium]|nr:3-isopropylmalate dehydrogenase [Rhodospirillaceae bacterium]